MSKQGTIEGQWEIGKSMIQCVLPLISFFEDNNFIGKNGQIDHLAPV